VCVYAILARALSRIFIEYLPNCHYQSGAVLIYFDLSIFQGTDSKYYSKYYSITIRKSLMLRLHVRNVSCVSVYAGCTHAILARVLCLSLLLHREIPAITCIFRSDDPRSCDENTHRLIEQRVGRVFTPAPNRYQLSKLISPGWISKSILRRLPLSLFLSLSLFFSL